MNSSPPPPPPTVTTTEAIAHRQTERQAIRAAAKSLDRELDRRRPLTRGEMEGRARDLLTRLSLPEADLGFAMVAINNIFWLPQFAAVPFPRRLLLLPRCLRKTDHCGGILDHHGLTCAACGACAIDTLSRQATTLGYRIRVAEGSPGVLPNLMTLRPEALLGVACQDSLEKAFRHVAPLGIPHLAVPLLNDGCTETQAEIPEILRLLQARAAPPLIRTPHYVPLLAETDRMFDRSVLQSRMAPYFPDLGEVDKRGMGDTTGAVLLDWLATGGKRFRPFMTAAAYAVTQHGSAAFDPTEDLAAAIPPRVRDLCLAIEALHKASLVHDDIEDGDDMRYGRPTLHRQHGIGPAVNFGDALVGLGYRWIAAQSSSMGADCVADILAHVAAAQIELCRGQAAELFWLQQRRTPRPLDVLEMYALKTSPAFETALITGLRAAGYTGPHDALRRFATLTGEAFQVMNDVADWHHATDDPSGIGRDVLARRPTILRAFAVEAGGEDHLHRLESRPPQPETVESIRHLYAELGVFKRTNALYRKLRQRAEDAARTIAPAALRPLLQYVLSVVLAPEPPAAHTEDPPPPHTGIPPS